MATYTIEISCDHHEGTEFCAWLNARGHNATIGNSTGNYVDGVVTLDETANSIMNQLWADYCNNATPEMIDDLAARMSVTPDDHAILVSEGQFEGFDASETNDRCMGHTDWVGYLPSCGRAAWVSNGDPVWFDASSLDDAVSQIINGDDLRS